MTTEDNTPLKRCSQCKQQYHATTDHFSRDKSHKDGLATTCKECNRIKAAIWRKQNFEREKENNRQWRLAHPEQSRRTRQTYYLNHKDEHRIQGARWNKENRAWVNELSRKWAKTHPEQMRKNAHCRRALKANAPGSHTATDIDCLYINQRGLCAYCGCKLNNKYHVDHVVPLSRGGSNNPDNLVLACATCNTSKGDKLISEWVR